MTQPAPGVRDVVHYATPRMTYVVVNGYCTNILDPGGTVLTGHPMIGTRLEGGASARTLAPSSGTVIGERLKFRDGPITWFTDPVTEIIRYAKPKAEQPSGTRLAATAEINVRAAAS